MTAAASISERRSEQRGNNVTGAAARALSLMPHKWARHTKADIAALRDAAHEALRGQHPASVRGVFYLPYVPGLVSGASIMTTGSPECPVRAMMAGGQKNAPIIDFASRLIDDRGWSNTMSSYPDPGAGVHARGPALRAYTGSSVLLPVEPSTIPRELVQLRAWYPAIIRPKANGKPGLDKIPGDPVTGRPALWRDPSTRCTFNTAYMAYESGRFLGIGFMMHTESGLIGVDIDKCIAPDGTVTPWALEIARSFTGAYWERSISGTGLRGFCRGTMPGGARAKKTTLHGSSVEMYANLRFLVVTGQEVVL